MGIKIEDDNIKKWTILTQDGHYTLLVCTHQLVVYYQKVSQLSVSQLLYLILYNLTSNMSTEVLQGSLFLE